MESSIKAGIKTFFQDWKGKAWFVINMFCTTAYLVWRIFFTIPFGYGVISVIAGVSLLIVEALGMIEALVHYVNMYSVRNYALPDVPKELFPDVDIFIATYSEERKLLYKTVNGCKHMKYPDKSKVHIYLCDDNRRPEIRALAAEMGVNYLDRPDNEGAKAGNLNNALAHSTSPYVVTLDADMIPKSDFLMKTIPYFVDCNIKNEGRKEEDKIKLGFVQTPQCFYNPDLFQFNLFSEGRIPNEQDYFYRDIQVARTRSNSVIYGGSNTVLSREALESVGGFFTGAITEDFATGILIERAGYVSLGVGEPLASGLSATDLQSLIQQRVRWGRGVIATGRKMRIYTSSNLSFAQKMNYWASIWYWYAPLKRLIYIMSPILYSVFGFMVLKCTLPQVLLFWLPMYITSNISLRMLSNNIRNTKWTNVYETVLFPFMLLPIIAETFGITLKKFKVTNKEGQQNQKGKNVIYLIPFFILTVLSIIGIIRCILIMFDSSSFGPIVILFWLINNTYLLIMSFFFVDGRVPYRKAERVSVTMPCQVNDELRQIEGVTRDISETGISVLLDKPYYFEADAGVDVALQWGEYHADIAATIVFVTQQGDKWNYSMKITDYKDTYDDYLQMLYDRVPVLPQEIKKDSGSFEDLKLNTKKRVTTPFFQKRQYPRILLDTMVKCEDMPEGTIKLYDFNYCYATLQSESAPQKLALEVTDGIVLNGIYETEISTGNKLYRIENCEEITKDRMKSDRLIEWLAITNAKAQGRKAEAPQIKERKGGAEKGKEEFNESQLL